MGKSKKLKTYRKEARKIFEPLVDEQIKKNMITLETLLKPRPRFMPRFFWRLLGKIFFKVPLP